MRGLKTIIFLIISNTFMAFAWYGHLKFKDFSWGKNMALFTVILISWGMAFFEYLFQVPASIELQIFINHASAQKANQINPVLY